MRDALYILHVRICLTMQAVLQMSAGVLYPAPIRTSMERYCLVWMSSVKCLCCTSKSRENTKYLISLSAAINTLCSSLINSDSSAPRCRNKFYLSVCLSVCLTTQQAFPRSAILTRIDSAFRGSSGLMRRSAALARTEREQNGK